MKKEFLYIKTIAQLGSISKAATSLYISQPSLSHCLGSVEERLGTKLFLRSTKGLTLTYAGESYVKMAEEILQIYDDFQDNITELNELKKGRITFGLTNYLGPLYLPKVLPYFHEKYPNITLEIEEHNSETLEQYLAEQKLHFALMHTTPKIQKTYDSRIKAHPLINEPFVLVTGKNSRYSQLSTQNAGEPYPTVLPSQLKNEKFVLVKRGQRIRHVTDHLFQKADLTPDIVMDTKNFETARRLACEGMGVTICPLTYCSLFSGSYKADYFLLPPEFEAEWTLSIAVSNQDYLPVAARELIHCFYKEIKREHPTLCQPLELS